MSNVLPLSSTCEYLVSRAASHRRAGRYDEAMSLLARARETYGLNENTEFELAQTYEEIGCEDAAMRSYLRIVRMGGDKLAQALFHLALTSAQRADLPRALSYYERFAASDRSGVSEEYADLFLSQLRRQLEKPTPSTRKQRARVLEERAVIRLQEGKLAAAERTMRHAMKLHEHARGYTMLSCCCLLSGRGEDAVRFARTAHSMARKNVQTLCVMADACALTGDQRGMRRAISLAAYCADDTEDLSAAAAECMKHGEDALALRLTGRILKREPFHTRAMMMRACALTNLGRLQEASRLFGRICGLLPEDSVSESLYRMTRSGSAPKERLIMGLDVTAGEAEERITRLIVELQGDGKGIEEDPERLRHLCRISAWAIRSPLAGRHGALMAIMLMNGVDAPAALEVLLDALMDPAVGDGIKMALLQVITSKHGVHPYYADVGGRLTRVAAGGSSGSVRTPTGQAVVQHAADRLMAKFPDSPSVMLDMWIAYLDVYGAPEKKHMDTCSAALEALYHEASGRHVSIRAITGPLGVSPRACRHYVRRIKKAVARRRLNNDEQHGTET